MIPDTDEQLIEMAKKFGFEGTDFEEIIAHYSKELRALINHYIAKDRAQGQEPVGVYHVHAQGCCIGMVGDTKLPIGDYPVYTHTQPVQGQEPVGYIATYKFNRKINFTPPANVDYRFWKLIPVYSHAQPIAEIQAEALEKAANSDWHDRRDLSYKEYLIKLAAKLRRGESIQ